MKNNHNDPDVVIFFLRGTSTSVGLLRPLSCTTDTTNGPARVLCHSLTTYLATSTPPISPAPLSPTSQVVPPWTRFYGETPPLPTPKSGTQLVLAVGPSHLVDGRRQNPASAATIIGWQLLPYFLVGLPAQPRLGRPKVAQCEQCFLSFSCGLA
jgi:hypothetical protein